MERFVIAVVALVLLWRAITVNALLYGEDGRPRAREAEASIAPGADPQRGLLEATLRDVPANAAAYLTLAQDYATNGDALRARRAYAAAYAVAPFDRDVLVASAGDLLRAGEVAEALPLLATAVGNYADTREAAFPVMIASLASAREAAAWDAIVAADPPWLGDFIVQSCGAAADPAALLPLFMKRVARHTAGARETGCITRRAQSYLLGSLSDDVLTEVAFRLKGAPLYADKR